MVGMRRAAAATVGACALALAACGSDGGVPDQSDGGADAAVDAIVGTTCVQYGNEADLRMAIAGAHDGYLNWRSEGVECDGSFGEHYISWRIEGLHTVTLLVPDLVATWTANDNPAQLVLVLSGGDYDTGPNGCVVNVFDNFEHDPEHYPGIFKVRGNGECAEPVLPQPAGGEHVNIVGPFAFTGYVLTAD
jgi:hypothetical protein